MNQFQVLKQLGSGSFGRVLKVRRKEDLGIFAMKTIRMEQLNAKEKDSALNEVRLLASIDSPNVIKYKGAFFQQYGNILSIVMEFADGGDLSGLIEKKIAKNDRFQENFIWKTACDILKGLKFLHQSNIIHRDIKSANVFFASGVAKLGDLNVSKVMQGNFASTQTGTPYYTSPQIWLAKKYTSNCDIWSLGCVLYEMCSLRPPFMAKDFPGLMRRVTAGYYEPIPSKYSKKLALVIRRCLTLDHLKRPSAAQLLQTDVFLMMDSTEEGEIDLLDTIRCPRVLRLINNKLPQNQYTQRKPKTLKVIADDLSKNGQNNYGIGSAKRIGSQKNIASIQKLHHYYRSPLPIPQQPLHQPILIQQQVLQTPAQLSPNRNVMQNIPMNSPNGYVRLPRIGSYKMLQ